MRVGIAFIIVVGVVIMTACQPNAVDTNAPEKITPGQTAVPVLPTLQEAPMTPSLSPTAGSPLENLIQMTKSDLASRLVISVEEITLVEATEVEWSDSSLDCPQPGMEYLQVTTPGYRIVLQANDQIYEYHTNRNAYFVFCES